MEECKVDIISMSFGSWELDYNIEDALERAVKKDVLLFAAACNGGANQPRAWPARRDDVFCIHACDGLGNKATTNPNPLAQNDNFTVLGVNITSRWKEEVVEKSGTSFATPVAAGFAANIIEFAKLHWDLDGAGLAKQRNLKKICTFSGMRAVFRALCRVPGPETTNRDGYDYVNLKNCWFERGQGNVQGLKANNKVDKYLHEVISAQ